MGPDPGPDPAGGYPSAPMVAVGAVVLHEGAVLLVRRGRPPAEGSWAIPGGGVRLGETLQQAAEREILEETGVVIRAGEPIFSFDLIERDAAGRVRFHYVIVDLAADYAGGSPRAGSDASDARWVPASELKDVPINPQTRRLLGERFGFGR